MAGRRKLKASVVVNGTLYVAGSRIDDDVAAQITNPDALEQQSSDDGDPSGLPAGLTVSEDGSLLNWRGENYVRKTDADARVAAVEQTADDRVAAAEQAAVDQVAASEASAAEQVAAAQAAAADSGASRPPPAPETQEPPRSGPGSGVEAWRTYAGTRDGVEVPDGATRDEIIAAVDAAK